MIGRLSGILAEKVPPQVLIDVNGVGYQVDVPMSTFYNLPDLGQKTVLLTHFVVREDAQILFGFATSEERETFRQLILVFVNVSDRKNASRVIELVGGKKSGQWRSYANKNGLHTKLKRKV